MFGIHGLYKFSPRRVAYRNDYCMVCNAPRRAEQIRTLDAIHVYFVPLIPMGAWRRWHCCECGMCPHQVHLTAWLLKITTLGFFIFATVFFWGLYFLVVPAIAEDRELFWFFGVICPAGALAMGTHLAVWEPVESSYKERLSAVPPADETICPFCECPMIDEYFECHCPECGVRRL